MKKNLLVTLADKNFIKQAKQLFSSVYWNAGWKGDYMLLAHEIPEKDLKWFKDKGILIKRCKPISTKKTIGILKHPRVILAKFNLFEQYFKYWDKIIFLDADIIVRGPIEELLKVKGFGAYYAKHSVFRIWKLLDNFSEGLNKKMYTRLKNGLHSNPYSFNTGVMVINTSIIKKNTFKEVIKLYERYKKISLYNEESILNLFILEKWEKFSQVYNLRPDHLIRFYSKKPKKMKGIVVHFIGKENSPWIQKNPFYKEWNNNLRRADLIDLKRVDKKWNKLAIFIYDSYTKFRLIFLLIKIRSKIIWRKILDYIDRQIGLNLNLYIDENIGKLGILLRKIDPKLYYKIKKIKKKLGLK